jgi:hypothetical protein
MSSALALAGRLVDELLPFARAELAKAATSGAIRRRRRLVAGHAQGLAAELAAYFRDLERRLLGVAKAVEVDPDALDWAAERSELRTILGRWYETLGTEALAGVAEQLGLDIGELEVRDLGALRERLGRSVVGITETSRQELVDLVTRGIAEGQSAEQLTGALRGVFDTWSDSRARTIALTESADAYNLSAIAGYASSGLVEAVEVFDGTGDEGCAEAAGATWTLEQAASNPTEHPNCQRAFAPIVTR